MIATRPSHHAGRLCAPSSVEDLLTTMTRDTEVDPYTWAASSPDARYWKSIHTPVYLGCKQARSDEMQMHLAHKILFHAFERGHPLFLHGCGFTSLLLRKADVLLEACELIPCGLQPGQRDGVRMTRLRQEPLTGATCEMSLGTNVAPRRTRPAGCIVRASARDRPEDAHRLRPRVPPPWPPPGG